jgi:alkylmercury lyase
MGVLAANLKDFIAGLVNLLAIPDESERQLIRALYSQLADALPVEHETLAEVLNLSPVAVRRALDSLPHRLIEFDGHGRVTEFGGLGLNPTPHRFNVRGNPLYTWCALDSLFIPPILAETAVIVSTAPTTGDQIHLTVGPTGLQDVEPREAVMTIATPEVAVMRASESVADVQFAFCDWVHFFASPEAAHEWLQDNRGPVVVTVAQAHALTTHLNALRFPDLAA